MSRDFARKFYSSKSWRVTSDAYRKSVRHCERCWAKGIISTGAIVHHKVHLSPANINDPNVALNPDNLELLCRECHAQEHSRCTQVESRVCFDEEGNVIERKEG